MGRIVDNNDSLFYGGHTNFLQRKWVDYVQDIDTNVFGESRVYVTFKGTGRIKLIGKDFEDVSPLIQSFDFEEKLIFIGKLPPKTTVQAIAPKNRKKLELKRIRIRPCLK